MLCRIAITASLLASAVILPATATAAKPPAATLKNPTIAWVRIGVVTASKGITSPLQGRVVVRVLVRHASIHDAVPNVRSIGSVTVVLSRFERDRDLSVGGGTAAWALPVQERPLGVVYRMTLNAKQSASVQRASRDGVLRALVLLEQRVLAKGRAPARAGLFQQVDAKVLALPLPLPIDPPPLLTNGAVTRVVLGAGANGRAIVERVELPLAGGRLLVLVTGGKAANGLVAADGSASPLAGTARILSADGTTLAEAVAPAGISLALGVTAPQRGTLTWPAFELPGADSVPAGSLVVQPLSVKG